MSGLIWIQTVDTPRVFLYRNWHETVIQRRISHMENTTENQEPATGTGTLPDVDDDEIQVP